MPGSVSDSYDGPVDDVDRTPPPRWAYEPITDEEYAAVVAEWRRGLRTEAERDEDEYRARVRALKGREGVEEERKRLNKLAREA